MGTTHVLRRVTAVHEQPGAVEVHLLAVRLDGAPGWLTGEPLADQGVETTMPNLPDLALPALDEQRWVLRVEAAGPRGLRLLVARDGARAIHELPGWLGIVTDPLLVAAGGERDDGGRSPLRVEREEDRLVVTTASGHRLVLGLAPLTLHVEDPDGRVVLRGADRLRQVAGLPTAPLLAAGPDGLALQLELAADEDVTGFGEQFSRLVKNGQLLELRVEDALGTGTGMTYKPVPVWHSTRGWSGFLNTGTTVRADVGHSRPSVLSLAVPDDALDLYLFLGDGAAERLLDHTALTGRPGVPPLWALGYWMGRCRYHSAAEVLEVAESMREHAVPCDVLHVDPDWLVVDRLSTDFIWSTERFGDRRAFVSALRERGVRLSLWELPYLDPASPRYAEAEVAGHLVRTTGGETAHVRGTPTPDGRHRALVDLSSPAAREWWQGMHVELLTDGVAVFKTDFGEGLPDDAALADGTPPHHAHNLYPLKYNGAVSDVIARTTGRSPLVWGRSGWAGSQRYPGQWGGDAESTVAGMQATVRGGLSYALSAPGFWSHDIGGFFGPELTPALYVRWTQLGALSPLMRAHGLRPREPWAFGERALAFARDWVRLRYSLLPYLWQVAQEAAEGRPMMRPLGYHFPDDPVAPGVDDCFLLGRDLLVVPVFDDGEQDVLRRWYLPPGRWRDLITGEVRDGERFVSEQVPLERMPLLVRQGAPLPRVHVGEHVRGTDDLLEEPWHLDGAAAAGEHRLVGFDGEALVLATTGAVWTDGAGR